MLANGVTGRRWIWAMYKVQLRPRYQYNYEIKNMVHITCRRIHFDDGMHD